jgi:hypothetical protein
VEGVLNLLDEFIVINVASANDDHVVTEIVRGSVCLEIVNSQTGGVVSITLDRLAHLMVSVGVVMGVFHSGVFVFLSVHGVFVSQVFFTELELSSVEGSVA